MVRIFGHYVSRSFILLGILENLLLQAAIGVSVWLRFGDIDPATLEVPIYPVWPKAMVYSLVMLLCLVAVGLYHRDHRATSGGVLLRIIIALMLGSLAMSVLFYLFPVLFFGRGVFAISLGLSLAALIFSRALFLRTTDHKVWHRRVLVLGSGENARRISDLKKEWPRCGFKMIGFFHIQGEHDEVPQHMILPHDRSLLDIVQQQRVDEIVVTVRNRWQGIPIDDLLERKLRGVTVTDLPTFFERETGRIKLDLVYPSWLVFSDGFDQHFLQQQGKRLFDIGISLLFLFFTWPLMLLTALAIWVDSGFKGPIIYRQVRVGKDWQLLQVMKFRSMRVDAEKDGEAIWAKKNDDRVTRVGCIIRKFRIDELPQLFNVIKGDMSFVGPRPERPEFVEELSGTIPYYAERLRVKPGITGWAQVRYQYAATTEDSYNKLEFDLYYVKNFGLFLDFLILLYTAEVVLWRKGAV